MKRRQLLKHLAASIPATILMRQLFAADHILNSSSQNTASGPFEPNWGSLSSYKAPDWFRNAKFGIWAHWGPQCQPGQGDWYARSMYEENSSDYKWQVAHYGHPSKAGFKEVIRDWKAENWEPEKLVALYKRTGAQYFVAMANHHDNLDLWDSKHQEWNSVRVGPQKNIIGGWAEAAKKQALPFGVSVHAAHAWSFYQTSQGSDKSGPMAGMPYDGNLTKVDGKGTWWEGMDPQELYAQKHELGNVWDWDWDNKADWPSQAYCEKFYNRTMDLIKQYNPDLIYFDDTSLPLHPASDVGLKIAANYYNQNLATHNGRLNAVLFGKKLKTEEKKCLVWDVEGGVPASTQSLPWQTCSCIGNWHYDIGLYERNGYKSAESVIKMLIDIVSKNGNLLLNIPVRGDGTIDDKEIAILNNITAWMDINKESIFDTRPWKIFGEGSLANASTPLKAQDYSEGKTKPTAKDIRFNQKGNIIYVTVLGPPAEDIVIKAFGKNTEPGEIKKIELLGSTETVYWEQNAGSMTIKKPATVPNNIAVVFKIQK